MLELGHHYIAEFTGCPAHLLRHKDSVRQSIIEAAQVAKVTIVGEHFHQFSPEGVTGVLLLAESHLSIHTWPEYGYCAIDLFTCGDAQAARKAIQYLEKTFEAEKVSLSTLRRGPRDDVASHTENARVLYATFP